MRFHIGFSKRISVKTLIEILGLLFVGLMAFLGLSDHAFAETNGNVSMIPNAMYFHTNSSGSDVSPTSFGSKTCAFDSSKTCFYMYGFNVNAFSPQDFNFIYNAKNLCSNNNNLSTITFRGIMQSPAGTNVRGNLQAYQSNSSLANLTMVFQSNNVFTITTKYDTSKQLRLRFNSSLSDNSIYYMELTNDNPYTCEYTSQDAAQDITTNANQNTENIINNNNQNTQDIINNNNSNTQAIIEAQNVCKMVDKESVILTDRSLNVNNGNINSYTSTGYGTTDFIYIEQSKIKVLTSMNWGITYCFYNVNKSFISCGQTLPAQVNTTLTIPSNASYFRTSIWLSDNKPSYEICTSGNQAIVNSNNQLNDTLNNSDVSGASSTGNGFFDNFSVDDQLGLASIASAPVRLFQTLVNSNDSCLPLTLNLDLGSNYQKTVTVPGGCLLWDNVPTAVEALYFAVVFGLFGYRILIDMYHFLSSLRDPDKKNEFTLDL